MKNKLLIYWIMLLSLLFTSNLHAQQTNLNCDQKVTKALVLLKGSSTVLQDYSKALQILTECANNGNSEAQYQLGMIYKVRKGVSNNERLAYKFISESAKQGHPLATCELGVLYKDGVGCDLNFDKAIEWFKKAEELGNSKGSYSIGYMHLKGLGSVEQNYSEAIRWFEKSDYPMAKHWLAVCYQLGYGVGKNDNKALELFLANPTRNSKNLLAHFENNPDLLSLGNQKENAVKATEFGVSKINETISANTQDEPIKISNNSLAGEWNGKLIELDWSGEQIQRSFPVSLNFSKDLKYTLSVANSSDSGTGTLVGDIM